MMYGEHFYDLTWNNGITHEQLLADIEIPCIYLHAKEEKADNGVYLCAASKEQAERAVSLIGDNCQLIDSLVAFTGKIGVTNLTPGPKGKHIFGTTKINDRGQIVIPKRARDLFGINDGDALVVLGDEAEGIAIMKADIFERRLNASWNSMKQEINE